MKSVNQTLVYQNPELPVPPLRYDINMIPFNDEDGDWVLFYDTFGYAVPDMTLPSNFAPLFQLFDGRQTLSSIHKQYFRKSDFSLSDLTNLIYQLDQSRLLHSSYFRKFVDEFEGAFETSANRLATCTDSCYPSDSSELRKWLDAAFAEHPNSEPTPFKALYAPHIDYRVGIKTYVKAFSALRELKPKRVVILGTSHYAGYYGKLYENRPFIFSGKDLKTPLGLLKSNKSIHDQASKLDGLQYGISMNDRAHRVEHSIELHALLCQYLWGDAIEVVSVLVGSLEEYVLFESGTQGKQIQKMASFIRSLDDGETLFLVSGDQAHIGKKFGDVEMASEIIEDVRKFDENYLNAAKEAKMKDIHQIMGDSEDQYRICGFPPLALFLHAFPEAKGTLIDYDYWDESEQKSGVTFAAIGYQLN